jgi:hypothetical protein
VFRSLGSMRVGEFDTFPVSGEAIALARVTDQVPQQALSRALP